MVMVTRYKPEIETYPAHDQSGWTDYAVMEESESGDYVKYEDLLEIQRRNVQLQKDATDLIRWATFRIKELEETIESMHYEFTEERDW